MKRVLISIGLVACSALAQAQSLEKFTFGLQFAPGSTLARITDDDATPSRKSLSSDGYTTIEENGLKGINIKLMVNYELNDKFDFSSGLYFGEYSMNVRNDDGNYIGTSVYHTNYASLPILLKYKGKELKDNLFFVASVGPTLDFLTSEEAKGADYAHFMNFAHNRFDIDAQRGRNGSSKSMNLFSKTGVSILGSAGLEYKLTDRFKACFGVSYQQGVTNMLNGKLLFNDTNKTPITETTKWTRSLLAVDFGVIFHLNDL
jgi:long-subunit fatty acid transport protein